VRQGLRGQGPQAAGAPGPSRAAPLTEEPAKPAGSASFCRLHQGAESCIRTRHCPRVGQAADSAACPREGPRSEAALTETLYSKLTLEYCYCMICAFL